MVEEIHTEVFAPFNGILQVCDFCDVLSSAEIDLNRDSRNADSHDNLKQTELLSEAIRRPGVMQRGAYQTKYQKVVIPVWASNNKEARVHSNQDAYHRNTPESQNSGIVRNTTLTDGHGGAFSICWLTSGVDCLRVGKGGSGTLVVQWITLTAL